MLEFLTLSAIATIFTLASAICGYIIATWQWENAARTGLPVTRKNRVFFVVDAADASTRERELCSGPHLQTLTQVRPPANAGIPPPKPGGLH